MRAEVVTCRPEARSMPPKVSMARRRSRGAAIASALGGDEAAYAARGELPLETLDVIDVLDHAAERLRHERLVEVVRVKRGQRLGPVERLGDARHLGEAERPRRLHEARDLLGQALVDPGNLARENPHFLLEAGKAYPQVEAAAAERGPQLADAVGPEDDIRRLGRLDGADLGDRHLKVREHLEKEGLELLIPPLDLGAQ